MLRTRLHITAYAPRHRSDLLHLSCRSRWTHQHLDWHAPRQWIDAGAGHVLLAWRDERLVGWMGLSPAVNGACWIRLLGIGDGHILAPIIEELWGGARARLRPGVSVMLLMASPWLNAYARQLGFACLERIITLSRVGGELPAAPLSPVEMRSARAADLPDIARIDRLAFAPPWQMTSDELRQAFRISSQTTVALFAGDIVGYQMGSRHQENGHLARLAVMPTHQGRRIGAALLHEGLREFNRQCVHAVTVNTQRGNRASQCLYQRFGFCRNGFDLEVWQKTLEGGL